MILRKNKMADKWEMCALDLFEIQIWSPGQPTKKVRYEKFLESLGMSIKKPNLVNETLTYLLENGWEPYATSRSVFFLKRKLV
jgi:hypothetical protein